MYKIFICFFAMCFCISAFGQNNVGIGTSTPNPGAVLDLTSPSMGFLVPRTHVALVTAPTLGLVIYDSDSNCFVFYNSASHWQNLCTPNLPPQSFGINDNIYINANGTITVVDSNGLNILTSPQSAWTTLGNSGTTAGTNFAGTTDAQDFVLKSNNNEVIRATQAGAVGINTVTPDPTSILDITSSTRGVLFPALTSAQRDAITGPAVGLTIYDTDLNVHQFWNGTCWVNVGQTVCSFTYALTQSHNSDCLFKSNFNSVADTLTLSLISGTASPVVLSAAGVPAGVLVNFSNNYIDPTQTSIMTLTALPSAPDGTYTITILATSGSTTQTLIYTLTVYDFAVTLSPSSSTVTLAAAQAGGIIATSTITIGNSSACTTAVGNAQLTYTISPSNPGLQVSFANPNLPVPGSTTMTITSTCALQGTYQIYVTSTIGVSVTTSVYTLTISGPVPFHISVNTQNVNLYVLAGQPSCPVVDTFIVDPGVTVGSNSTAQLAAGASLATGGFTAGSHIVLINNGIIEGAGGNGGDKIGYGSYLGGCGGVGDGGMGGNALDIGTGNVVIDNLGLIESGGGGGGGGQDLSITLCTVDIRPGSGGGGGAGSNPGNGGTDAGGSYPCQAGANGTTTAGGAGGGTCQQGPCFLSFGNHYDNGPGGIGGNPGQAGIVGGNANGPIGGTGACGAGNGGSPGYSIDAHGNAYTLNGAAVIGPVLP
jgi:hypothetical protein